MASDSLKRGTIKIFIQSMLTLPHFSFPAAHRDITHLLHSIKDWEAQVHLASFPRSGSSNKSGAILQGLLAVKGALRGKSKRLMRKGRLGSLKAIFSRLEKETEQVNYFSEHNNNIPSILINLLNIVLSHEAKQASAKPKQLLLRISHTLVYTLYLFSTTVELLMSHIPLYSI